MIHSCFWCGADIKGILCKCSAAPLVEIKNKMVQATTLLEGQVPFHVIASIHERISRIEIAITQHSELTEEVLQNSSKHYSFGPWRRIPQGFMARSIHDTAELVYIAECKNPEAYYLSTTLGAMKHLFTIFFKGKVYKSIGEAQNVFDSWALRQGWGLK
jgi:hypothetical protein